MRVQCYLLQLAHLLSFVSHSLPPLSLFNVLNSIVLLVWFEWQYLLFLKLVFMMLS